MKRYAAALKVHLGDYARRRLGVEEFGLYKGHQYAHILPEHLRYLNLLASASAGIRAHLEAHPQIKEHQFFHHLNSSQAFAFNLFYPYFAAGGPAARILSKSLGVDADVETWEFEAVPDTDEGTNVDVCWTTTEGVRVYCEVKLTESEFGQAKVDSRHMEKLRSIYAPRLDSLVSRDLLAPEAFFAHYQILRNISLLAERNADQLIFLMPRENEALEAPMTRTLASVSGHVRDRIHVAYVEDCLDILESARSLSTPLRAYAGELKEKYVL